MNPLCADSPVGPAGSGLSQPPGTWSEFALHRGLMRHGVQSWTPGTAQPLRSLAPLALGSASSSGPRGDPQPGWGGEAPGSWTSWASPSEIRKLHGVSCRRSRPSRRLLSHSGRVTAELGIDPAGPWGWPGVTRLWASESPALAGPSSVSPCLSPESWMALPDFPDYHKWGFSVAALNNHVYVTGRRAAVRLLHDPRPRPFQNLPDSSTKEITLLGDCGCGLCAQAQGPL